MLRLGWLGGQAVDAPVLRPALAALLAATLSGSAAMAAAAPCGMIGASYVSWPPHPGPVYRMTTALLPPGADGSAVLTQWRFRAIDPHSGVTLGTLNMMYGCSNGRGPCATWPASHSRADGGYYSTVLQLARNFSPARGNEAPYAIILADVGQLDWEFAATDLAADLVLPVGRHVVPDLQNRVVWLRRSCRTATP